MPDEVHAERAILDLAELLDDGCPQDRVVLQLVQHRIRERGDVVAHKLPEGFGGEQRVHGFSAYPDEDIAETHHRRRPHVAP